MTSDDQYMARVQRIIDEKFDLVRCLDCHVEFLTPKWIYHAYCQDCYLNDYPPEILARRRAVNNSAKITDWLPPHSILPLRAGGAA